MCGIKRAAMFCAVTILSVYSSPSAFAGNDPPSSNSGLEERAASGDSSAMMYLAELYLIRADKTADYSPALNWFSRAAQAGRIEAMLRLHDVYSFQLRDEQDAKTKADFWIETAKAALQKKAEAGDLEAEMHLAYVCDLDGNVAEAMRWYRKAADNGSPDAMYELGAHYKLSWNVSEDAHEAIRWLLMAAAHGEVKAMVQLADAYRQGYGVDQDSGNAEAWDRKADEAEFAKAEAGNQAAMLDLASRDLRGERGAGNNAGEAIRLLTRAANAGNFQAAMELSLAYKLGKGLPQDSEQAEYWSHAAAQIGLPLDKFNWPEYY